MLLPSAANAAKAAKCLIPWRAPPCVCRGRRIKYYTCHTSGVFRTAEAESWYTVLLGLLPELRSAGRPKVTVVPGDAIRLCHVSDVSAVFQESTWCGCHLPQTQSTTTGICPGHKMLLNRMEPHLMICKQGYKRKQHLAQKHCRKTLQTQAGMNPCLFLVLFLSGNGTQLAETLQSRFVRYRFRNCSCLPGCQTSFIV